MSVPEGFNVHDDEHGPASYMFDDQGSRYAFVLPVTGVVPPDRVGSPVAADELGEVLQPVPGEWECI